MTVKTTPKMEPAFSADLLPPQVFHFTPSLMRAETLETMLVKRQPLAQRLTDAVREAASGGGKQHTYLVGPRGIGKTHLMALTYHRVRALTDLQDKLCIAWLREEEYGTDSFADLLMRICKALQMEYPAEFPSEQMETVYDASVPAQAAETLLKSFVGKRTLLVLMENADEIFERIKDKGQRSFRAFLQNTAFTTILATSQRLSGSVSKHEAPFYNFFAVEHLEEFGVDDAILLLKNLANLRGDKELADFLDSPTGRARVRAVNHLAGGNPRLYVIFSDFLTREALDDLVQPFLKMLDELTPYYQSRIGSLSTQQQKIVAFLCDNAAPATVKEIARRCFITQQTASGQLKDLKEKNFVCADPLGPTGRDTYYELCEPLMRLCLEVKKSRSGPLRLMIEFLRLWYPVPELRHRLSLCKPDKPIEREYILLAIESAKNSEDPRIRSCEQEISSLIKTKDFAQALKVSEELQNIIPIWEFYNKRAEIYLLSGEAEMALADVDKAIFLCASDSCISSLWANRATCQFHLDQKSQSLSSAEEAVRLSDTKAYALRVYAQILLHNECYVAALEASQKSVKLAPGNAEVWKTQGNVFGYLQRYAKAAQSFRKSIRLDSQDIEAWEGWIRAISCYKSDSDHLAAIDKAINCLPEQPMFWYEKAQFLESEEDFLSSVFCYNNAIKYAAKVPCAYFRRAGCFIALQKFSEARIDVQDGLSLVMNFSKHNMTAEEHCLHHTQSILENLLLYTLDVAHWGKQTELFTNAYKENDFLDELASALSESLNLLLSDRVTQAAAEAWNAAWKQTLTPFALPEFDLPLRLMQTAVDYKTTRDKKVLLRLPIEERKIIESALSDAEAKAAEEEEKVQSGSH